MRKKQYMKKQVKRLSLSRAFIKGVIPPLKKGRMVYPTWKK
jgi:hypothetical protein